MPGDLCGFGLVRVVAVLGHVWWWHANANPYRDDGGGQWWHGLPGPVKVTIMQYQDVSCGLQGL